MSNTRASSDPPLARDTKTPSPTAPPVPAHGRATPAPRRVCVDPKPAHAHDGNKVGMEMRVLFFGSPTKDFEAFCPCRRFLPRSLWDFQDIEKLNGKRRNAHYILFRRLHESSTA